MMRPPTIPCHPVQERERQIDLAAAAIAATGVFLSAAIWALAISKLFDLLS
jgi:hypothetical protein